MIRGSAALPLQGFLPFYFFVVRTFSILWTRLSRSLEQATLEVLRLRNTISFFFSKPFCAECLVKKAVHCHRRRSPFSLLLRKKAAPRRKWRYFSVQLQAFCCLEDRKAWQVCNRCRKTVPDSTSRLVKNCEFLDVRTRGMHSIITSCIFLCHIYGLNLTSSW